uniref:Uncharacterized protein n=1 Tax=Cacopsylla melanoneura TaxID=428564 RepID=A0A8D8SN43_9HEMI
MVMRASVPSRGPMMVACDACASVTTRQQDQTATSVYRSIMTLLGNEPVFRGLMSARRATVTAFQTGVSSTRSCTTGLDTEDTVWTARETGMVLTVRGVGTITIREPMIFTVPLVTVILLGRFTSSVTPRVGVSVNRV